MEKKKGFAGFLGPTNLQETCLALLLDWLTLRICKLEYIA